MTFDPNPQVVASVLRWCGEDGRRWLDALPGIVRDLQRRWQLTLAAPLPGGSHSYVAPARTAGGTDAVLKVPLRDDENRLEGAALAAYAGDGANRLYDYDDRTGALLLERLRPGTALADHPDRAEAIDIACAMVTRLRRLPPTGVAFVKVSDIASAWSTKMREAAPTLSTEQERRLTTRAAEIADQYSTNSAADFLVNRDCHLENILAAEREPWLLIDPKPLVGDPAFDAGYLLGDLVGEERTPTSAEAMIAILAARLDLPADRIAGWGMVRAIDNHLWYLSLGEPHNTPDLELAAAIAAVT